MRIEGGLALAESLPLDQLEIFDLNGNKFGDEGCEQLQNITELGKPTFNFCTGGVIKNRKEVSVRY